MSGDEPGERSAEHYEALWSALRRSQRVDPSPRPRRGRLRRAAFVVRVNDAALFRRLDRIRAALAGLRFVRQVPDYGLHLPLLELGGVAPRGARHGELGQSAVRRFAGAVADSLRGVHARDISVARVNAAEGRIFAEVDPTEAVVSLRERLAAATREAGVSIEADGSFLPTFPLAHVVARGDARELVTALEWFRDRPIGQVPMQAVTLVVRRVGTMGGMPAAELPLGR